MLCFSAHCTACSVLNDMTTTFTADSLQKLIRRDTKDKIFEFVEEDSVGTTKHFKSEVWKTFKFVKVVASGFIIPNLCCCHKCECVLICFFTKKAATGTNGPIFNKFPVYRAAIELDLNYIGPGLNYGGPLTSLSQA